MTLCIYKRNERKKVPLLLVCIPSVLYVLRLYGNHTTTIPTHEICILALWQVPHVHTPF